MINLAGILKGKINFSHVKMITLPIFTKYWNPTLKPPHFIAFYRNP